MNTRTKHGLRNRGKFGLRLLSLALPICGLAGGAARAADSDDANDATQIEAIIVTAQKRAQDIGDVPVSITAASGYQLAKEGITEPADLTKLVPSFTYQVSDYGTPVFTIRGVGFNDFSLGAGPTVTAYMDQVPLPYSVMTRGAILDLDRVEVLKGPQGTLFGENSTGGAVNFIAAKPSDVPTYGVDLSYGRFNDTTLQGFIGGPIAGTLSARVALRVEHAGGWQQSTTRPGDTLGAKDFIDARILLDWKPSDALRFELNLSGWRDGSQTQAGQFQAFTPSAPPAPINAPVYAALQNYPLAAHNALAADWDAGTDYHRDDKF